MKSSFPGLHRTIEEEMVAMKIFQFIFMIMVGCVFISPTALHADDELVNTFSIGDPPKPSITPEMMTKSRMMAIKNVNQLLHTPTDPVIGDPTATVTLVEFLDFKCPLSEKMDPDIQAVLLSNPDLKIIYKIVPLRGETSMYAAEAALAAKKQGKYIEFHKALMLAGSTLTQNNILSIAKSQGLNITQLKTDMKNPELAKQLDANVALFHTIGIPGTPGLFFTKSNLTDSAKNNAIIYMLGVFTEAELQNAIEKTIQ